MISRTTRRFFTSVNESALSSRTYQAFIALMDNYISDTEAVEIYTLEELAEIEEFLDAVFESDVMSTTTQFFIDKGERLVLKFKIQNVRKDNDRLSILWHPSDLLNN